MAKKQRLRELMTPDPVVLDAEATVVDAAKAMKVCDVGDVLVWSQGQLLGIVTDRDLVVRCLAADESSAESTRLGEICSRDVRALAPDTDVMQAIRLMQQQAIRRVPIVEDGRPIGIVSLGDLAMARDRDSALGQISAAPPNR